MVYRIESAAVQSLIEVLHRQSYTIIGPKVRGDALVYDEIDASADLPRGFVDEQRPGYYRLHENGDRTLFGYAVGPHSWKRILFPPTLKLFSSYKEGKTYSLPNKEDKDRNVEIKKYAFFGARSCEIHAMLVQDKVFLSNAYQDPHYRRLREQLFIVAVNCSNPADTCFCSSMSTGPKASSGFDLVLTEVADDKQLYYLVEIGSSRGEGVLTRIENRPAREDEVSKGEAIVHSAAVRMKRSVDTTNIKELLYQSSEHPEWDKVAARCLTCANCTMVCPTCFCHTIDDTTDLGGGEAMRNRRWDSCFNLDFSYIHGGSVRISTKARYRQWMTHKLASWMDQFGTSGCVGCGRCITWCPVGIDITEEAKLICENQTTE